MLCDKEYIRERAGLMLVSAARNRRALSEMPRDDFLDLALIYYIRGGIRQESDMPLPVRYEHLRAWGMTEDELKEAARENDLKEEVSLLVMNEELELKEYDRERAGRDDVPFIIMTNTSRIFGASVCARRGALSEMAGMLGADLAVIPSSVHEVLIIPSKDRSRLPELETIVREINITAVLPQDYLSDSVYYYDRVGAFLELDGTGKVHL